MLTKQNLCDRWQVSPDTVERIVKRDHIPKVKIGKFVRFRESDIDNYEQEHTYGIKIIKSKKGCAMKIV